MRKIEIKEERSLFESLTGCPARIVIEEGGKEIGEIVEKGWFCPRTIIESKDGEEIAEIEEKGIFFPRTVIEFKKGFLSDETEIFESSDYSSSTTYSSKEEATERAGRKEQEKKKAEKERENIDKESLRKIMDLEEKINRSRYKFERKIYRFHIEKALEECEKKQRGQKEKIIEEIKRIRKERASERDVYMEDGSRIIAKEVMRYCERSIGSLQDPVCSRYILNVYLIGDDWFIEIEWRIPQIGEYFMNNNPARRYNRRRFHLCRRVVGSDNPLRSQIVLKLGPSREVSYLLERR